MDHLQKKMTLLQKKQEQLNTEMNVLLEQRNKELLDILKHVPSPSALDSAVLAGGLLYVCDQAITNPELAQQWRERGLKFRKSKASNTKTFQAAS